MGVLYSHCSSSDRWVTLYNSVMKIKNALAHGSIIIGKRIGDISPEANKRLKWFDYYYCHGSNARLTCRHFDISPQTFYRWLNRYDSKNLKTLESHSHRPCHVRKPTYSTELLNAVRKLREKYPRWGKEKLAVLLQRENIEVSVSMVGRILKHLKDRGILIEALPTSPYESVDLLVLTPSGNQKNILWMFPVT